MQIMNRCHAELPEDPKGFQLTCASREMRGGAFDLLFRLRWDLPKRPGRRKYVLAGIAAELRNDRHLNATLETLLAKLRLCLRASEWLERQESRLGNGELAADLRQRLPPLDMPPEKNGLQAIVIFVPQASAEALGSELVKLIEEISPERYKVAVFAVGWAGWQNYGPLPDLGAPFNPKRATIIPAAWPTEAVTRFSEWLVPGPGNLRGVMRLHLNVPPGWKLGKVDGLEVNAKSRSHGEADAQTAMWYMYDELVIRLQGRRKGEEGTDEEADEEPWVDLDLRCGCGRHQNEPALFAARIHPRRMIPGDPLPVPDTTGHKPGEIHRWTDLTEAPLLTHLELLQQRMRELETFREEIFGEEIMVQHQVAMVGEAALKKKPALDVTLKEWVDQELIARCGNLVRRWSEPFVWEEARLEILLDAGLKNQRLSSACDRLLARLTGLGMRPRVRESIALFLASAIRGCQSAAQGEQSTGAPPIRQQSGGWDGVDPCIHIDLRCFMRRGGGWVSLARDGVLIAWREFFDDEGQVLATGPEDDSPCDVRSLVLDEAPSHPVLISVHGTIGVAGARLKRDALEHALACGHRHVVLDLTDCVVAENVAKAVARFLGLVTEAFAHWHGKLVLVGGESLDCEATRAPTVAEATAQFPPSPTPPVIFWPVMPLAAGKDAHAQLDLWEDHVDRAPGHEYLGEEFDRLIVSVLAPSESKARREEGYKRIIGILIREIEVAVTNHERAVPAIEAFLRRENTLKISDGYGAFIRQEGRVSGYRLVEDRTSRCVGCSCGGPHFQFTLALDQRWREYVAACLRVVEKAVGSWREGGDPLPHIVPELMEKLKGANKARVWDYGRGAFKAVFEPRLPEEAVIRCVEMLEDGPGEAAVAVS